MYAQDFVGLCRTWWREFDPITEIVDGLANRDQPFGPLGMPLRAPMALETSIRNDLNDRFGHAVTYRGMRRLFVGSRTLASDETSTIPDLIPTRIVLA